MSTARYSIGIDLGTTNCAVAFVPLAGEARSESLVLQIPQHGPSGTVSESAVLPSYLYLPPSDTPGGSWLPGRLARARAAETPGRVVHSAKSWLGHHAVDREAPFLPWRSDEIDPAERISPLYASSLLLAYIRLAWDGNPEFADAPFAAQQITITVPASFDAVAQRLTLDAAQLAGFPAQTRLLEEPQAAFYRWLEKHPEAMTTDGAEHHVAVVDIGGGTSDFSLFQIRLTEGLPEIERIAVSDHLLLGGDNIDLALAHAAAAKLPGTDLAPAQWNQLVAHCRDVKERCLGTEGTPDETFPLAVAGRGSGLFGGALRTQLTRGEIDAIVLDGFFPLCARGDRPVEAGEGLREWALPYAPDSAITKYLAEFLDGRPSVDTLLFNGGSLFPARLRQRIQQLIGSWQGNPLPDVLENPEPDLAVARGAAAFGALLARGEKRITAGAAQAIYLEVERRRSAVGGNTGRELVCILPHGTPSEVEIETRLPGLALRIGQPVRFQSFYSTRHETDAAGELVPFSTQKPLPSLVTTAKPPAGSKLRNAESIEVALRTRRNELGLLRIACVSLDRKAEAEWPLEFDLRPLESGATEPEPTAHPGVELSRLAQGTEALRKALQKPTGRDKLTANQLIQSLEKLLGQQKSDWNAALLREFWPVLAECIDCRKLSADHEEAWLILAGYFLRPGFGFPGDSDRIDTLWQLHEKGLAFPGKRSRLQLYILWRRVAGGLDASRQEALLQPELDALAGKNPAAELVRMAGAMERLPASMKERCITAFLDQASQLADAGGTPAAQLVALGQLLSRAPLYAGPESVVSPEWVEKAYQRLGSFDWKEQRLANIATCFLQAARVVDDPARDLPRSLREKIAKQLERADIPESRTERLRRHIPLERTDRGTLFGESLPAGLVLG